MSISLIEPEVLTGVVQEMEHLDEMILLNTLPKTPRLNTTIQWDIETEQTYIAQPNVPGAEAHVVPRLGRRQASATLMNLREKKIFETTTLRWLRATGTIAERNAEAAVMREVRDLNNRFDRFMEKTAWQALSDGVIHVNIAGADVEVDFYFEEGAAGVKGADGKYPGLSVTQDWNNATVDEIVEDVEAAIDRITVHSGMAPTTAYCSRSVLRLLVSAFVATGAGSAATGPGLSDSQRETYYRMGYIPEFPGLNWVRQDAMYDNTRDYLASTTAYSVEGLKRAKRERYLDANKVVICNLSGAMEVCEGPCADEDAPETLTGKFAKTWTEPDPSARQYLIDWNGLPIITKPNQIAILNIANDGLDSATDKGTNTYDYS